MKIPKRLIKLIYPGKSNDSKEINDLKRDMYSNTYCLIGFVFTIVYLLFDLFISSKVAMACIALTCFIGIILSMVFGINAVRKIIENKHSNLEKVKLILENIASITGLFAPVLFVVSVIINFL